MFNYQEAESQLIEKLSQDIQNHLEKNFKDIGNGFDYFDINLPRGDEPKYEIEKELEFRKLFIALNFWDSWQDARNHDWKYYDEIHKDDWPDLANILIENIKNKTEVTNTKILKHFALQK